MQVIKCNSNVMAITCHIFECNALHYNYVMRKKCPLQITFHYFENVIHYNYITITITITPGLVRTDLEKYLNLTLVLENSWNFKIVPFVLELSWKFVKLLLKM